MKKLIRNYIDLLLTFYADHFTHYLIIPLRRRRQSGILSSNCPAGTAVP